MNGGIDWKEGGFIFPVKITILKWMKTRRHRYLFLITAGFDQLNPNYCLLYYNKCRYMEGNKFKKQKSIKKQKVHMCL